MCGTNARVVALLAAKTEPMPGGVHEAHAAGEERARHERLDGDDALLVTRVSGLCDPVGEGIGRDRPPALRELHAGGPLGAVAQDGHHGRHGQDSYREDGVADERVQERRLAALDLADAGDVEAALGETLRERARILEDGVGAGGARQVGDGIELPLGHLPPTAATVVHALLRRRSLS